MEVTSSLVWRNNCGDTVPEPENHSGRDTGEICWVRNIGTLCGNCAKGLSFCRVSFTWRLAEDCEDGSNKESGEFEGSNHPPNDAQPSGAVPVVAGVVPPPQAPDPDE
ncbi:hypothetical protein CRG98_011695 [Punica granatum]|uniref:Uncharacterized protein n=1 Tax=Punica granatum TaxID=22663 RepID=A0A2I0KI19_PUNGR|nr:hypothetical protein CRG98_011695 [Punica granatum]